MYRRKEAVPDRLASRQRVDRAARTIVAIVAVAVALALPSTAGATHDGSGYWFWNGYLPKANGTNYVYHAGGGPICCSWVLVRMSWEPWTHDMRFIWLKYDGGWVGYWAQEGGHEYEWDRIGVLHASDFGGIRYGGCQNHVNWSWWPVWTNCHVRNYI
jgi:hypothetical protein